MGVTVQTLIVSTVLALVKILAGWLGHSYALIADGIESVLDIFSSLVVWSGLRIAARPSDATHPYGHGKAESLAAMVVSVMLVATGLGLAVQSVRQIISPHQAPRPFTIVVLVLVVVTKELLYRRLTRVAREIDSTSVRTDAWHQRSDALTSAAAFVGISIALIGGSGFEAADAWAALFACAIIVFNGLRFLRSAVYEVMDSAAPFDLEVDLRSTAEGVPGVVRIEKCRARKSGPGWLVDIHVEVDGALSVTEGHRIGHSVKDALCSSGAGVLDALVHIEPAEPVPVEGRPIADP
jgi:cation diffusion facilitator family transporter